MTTKTFCGILAAMLIVAMIWVLIPTRNELGNVHQTVSLLKPEDVIPDAVAAAEIAAIQSKAAGDLAHYTPRQAYEDLKRLLYLRTHVNMGSPVWFQDQEALHLLAQLRASHPDGRKFNYQVAQYTQSEEYRNISTDSPIRDIWNFSRIWQHWRNAYPLTILFAIPFFLCMLVRRGFNPFVELMMPLQDVWPLDGCGGFGFGGGEGGGGGSTG